MIFDVVVVIIAVCLFVLGAWCFWPLPPKSEKKKLFYVGATFTRHDEVRAVIDRITAMGYECAHDWTRNQDFEANGSLKADRQGGYVMKPHWLSESEKEVEAIRRVGKTGGFCVFLGEQASLGWPTEFGMSIMAGVPRICVVNPFKTTVFAALPQVMICASVDDAIARATGDLHLLGVQVESVSA